MKKATGPYAINENGERSDRKLWEAEMNPESEAKFDRYLEIKGINRAAKKELARRQIHKAFKEITEAFTDCDPNETD